MFGRGFFGQSFFGVSFWGGAGTVIPDIGDLEDATVAVIIPRLTLSVETPGGVALTKRVVRGTQVTFRATFADADGDAIAPTAVSLKLRQGSTRETLALTEETANEWAVVVDTGEWTRGLLYWSLAATGSGFSIVAEDYLHIVANPAH